MLYAFDLEEALRNLATALDIPPALYEAAVLRYTDVAAWLSAENSPLVQYDPEIYPQGSFRLGTMVRPIFRPDEFDIDLVCRLIIPKERTTQAALKKGVGSRLREDAKLAEILEEQRRCWRLQYPGQFHLDVLPAIPNAEGALESILLTDKELTRWQHSNPIEYANWFFAKMGDDFLEEERQTIAKAAGVTVDEVPVWRARTPLQRAIQLLKRHRCRYFKPGDDRTPVSIIITTLAAWAYEGERDVYGALVQVARDMPRYIECRNGRWWVANPANAEENFADKWNEKPERREAFLAWLRAVQEDLGIARLAKSAGDGGRVIAEKFGWNPVTTGVPAIRFDQVPALADARHQHAPQWPVMPLYRCTVSGDVYRGAKPLWPLSDRSLPKGVDLRFQAKTNAPAPYDVKWQVVNTGREAAAVGGLRGEFYDSQGRPGVRKESTAYAGTHWVEAFVVKEGRCVARSGRKLVKIRA